MRRSTIYFVAAFFLVFLSAPMLFHVLGFGETLSADNRALVTPSRPSVTDVVDTRYYAGITEYLKDTFPFRSEAILADASSDLALGDSPNTRVTLGRDGWLFYSPTLAARCFDSDVAAKAASQLALAHRVVEASGRSFRFLIAPDKAGVYSGKVPPGADNGCRESSTQMLLQELGGTEAAGSTITLWDAFEAAKPTNVLYYETDTHWNDYGASIAAKNLVNSIEPGLWVEDNLKQGDPFSSTRDLMTLIGLEREEVSRQLVVNRPDVEVDRAVVGQGKESVISSTARGSDSMITPVTAIIRDSFFSSVEPLVRQYFSEFQAAERFELIDDVGTEMILRADAVIVESVERHVYRRLLDGFGNRMMVVLAPDLDSTALTLLVDSPTSTRLTVVQPVSGSYLVLRGTQSDAEITFDIEGLPTGELPFADGYAVIPLRGETVSAVTISSPESLDIHTAYVVRLP